MVRPRKPPKPPQPRIFIVTGVELGRLTVGDPVYVASSHPLFATTPQSYLRQGKLREVRCTCGTERLISESILASGRLKSCGCLRKEINQKKTNEKFALLRVKTDKRETDRNIQSAREKLKLAELSGDLKTAETMRARLTSLAGKKRALGIAEAKIRADALAKSLRKRRSV